MSLRSRFSWKLKKTQKRHKKLTVYRWVDQRSEANEAASVEAEDEFLQYYRQYRPKNALPDNWEDQQDRLQRNNECVLYETPYAVTSLPVSPDYASLETPSRDSGRSSGDDNGSYGSDNRRKLWTYQGCKPPWFDRHHQFNKQIDEDSELDSITKYQFCPSRKYKRTKLFALLYLLHVRYVMTESRRLF